MGIEALPSSTVRTIGATQVLSDPASLIKELVDNALDAHSTSISIEIHSNTLDTIQVRDNGHGIPPDDRPLVARPHCTSKISGEEDLKAIGGKSLGFRGEALASAAEVSGALTISTRVEGEEVSTVLKINQKGEVNGQDRASLPVGTTVKIADFNKIHPVRRQTALKNSEKTLSKIKQTLKAYAFARTNVRFSLRVLKAKNDKGNWTYAPKPGGNAEDAAFKIVGAACASQCIWSVMEDNGYTVQAFLPKSDAEVSKYSGIGPFLSVDARPVSASRGTAKQIIKIFREALKNANPKADGVRDPFIFLDVRCPSASYDANVEPAKDDVLFEDPDILLKLARRVFEAVYPAPSDALRVSHRTQLGPDRSHELLQHEQEDDFVTSLEPIIAKQPQQPSGPWTPLPTSDPQALLADQTPTVYLDDAQGNAQGAPAHPFRSNMYGCDEEDLQFVDERPASSRTEADLEELRQARRDVTVSNPWILAKMNASIRHQPITVEDDEDTPLANQRESPRRRDQVEAQLCADHNEASWLPTPGPSSPVKPTAPLYHNSDSASVGQHESTEIQSLPPPGPTIVPPSSSDMASNDRAPGPHSNRTPAYNFNPPAQGEMSASGTPLQAIPSASSRRQQQPRKGLRQSEINAPFKPPLKDQTAPYKVWFDHLEGAEQRRSPRRPVQARQDDGLVVQGELGDLADDPRPLTPPRRNRDVRDFFTPQDRQAEQSLADLMESRDNPRERQGQAFDHSGKGDRHHGLNGESDSHEPQNGVLDGKGFVPASELASIESRFGPLKPDTSRPAKRRKTDDTRVLREISGNAAAQHDGIEGRQSIAQGERASPSRRRTTSKSRRTKSSRLPLERVSKGQGTHNLELEFPVGMRQVSALAGQVDDQRSLSSWNENALDSYESLTTLSDAAAVNDITIKLQKVLADFYPDGDMVQDLGVVLQGAFAAHSQAAQGAEA